MKQEYSIYNSPFGLIKIVAEDDAVISIKKVVESCNNGMPTSFLDEVSKQLNEYFEGRRITFSFPIKMKGTEFQHKVWNVLRQIPYGETRTYKEVAQMIGNSGASRAVGMANNKNPIAIVIPCHRVIGSDGKLTGYAGGLEMKARLLALEKEHKK